MECRFEVAERGPGAVIDQMPRQRTQMASNHARKPRTQFAERERPEPSRSGSLRCAEQTVEAPLIFLNDNSRG
jgi:hypothetical protein